MKHPILFIAVIFLLSAYALFGLCYCIIMYQIALMDANAAKRRRVIKKLEKEFFSQQK